MKRVDQWFWAGLSVATVASAAVFGPQLVAARTDLADERVESGRQVADINRIVSSCTLFEDGSASCPKGTFDVPAVKRPVVK